MSDAAPPIEENVTLEVAFFLSVQLYKRLQMKHVAGYSHPGQDIKLFAITVFVALFEFAMKPPKLAIIIGRSSSAVSSLSIRTTASVMLFCVLGVTASISAQAASPHRHAESSGCHNCGTVISTHTARKPAAKGSGIGIASGAVIGGLLGNQVGGGNGRTLATVAGAVGGGYAGNEVEKRVNSSTVTQVRVRMADGSVRTFSEAGNSRWHAGQRVKAINGTLTTRG